MKQGLSRWVWCSAGAAAIAGGLAGGCEFKDPTVGSFLSVGFARTQPATKDQGVVVVVQESGGSFLRLRTSNGTHQSTTSPKEGVESSCVALPAESSTEPKTAIDPLFFTVTPAKDECVLFVDLLSAGNDCTGEIVASRVLAVSRDRALQPEPATTSSGGAGGAGGKTGGAGGGTGGSTASGGAGGAGGKTGGAGGGTSTGGTGTGGTGGGQ